MSPHLTVPCPPPPGASSYGDTSTFTAAELSHSAVTSTPRISLAELEARLELIPPEQLSVVRLLGMGGFGEVYLAKWHSTDVAVKCLNPSLFSPDGNMGTASEGGGMLWCGAVALLCALKLAAGAGCCVAVDIAAQCIMLAASMGMATQRA